MERLSNPAQAGLVGEEGEAAFLDEGVAPEPKVFNQREDSPPYVVQGHWTAPQKNEIRTLNTTHKINSKGIKDLDMRSDSIELLEENTGQTHTDINHSSVFSDPPPRATTVKKPNGT